MSDSPWSERAACQEGMCERHFLLPGGTPGQRYAFEFANALALGVRRILIVSGPVIILALASNSRNAVTVFCNA